MAKINNDGDIIWFLAWGYTRPGKRLHSYGKIHHAINGKIHYKSPFSIAMLNYQRVAWG